MTRPPLPIDAHLAPRGRRGGARGTGAASGSPPRRFGTALQPGDGASQDALDALPLLLDSRQIAMLLGIGRTKTFQLMLRRQLPTIHIGRCVRVPRSALIGWIEGNIDGKVGESYTDLGA
jgi:excisionase family DNA binding protein